MAKTLIVVTPIGIRVPLKIFFSLTHYSVLSKYTTSLSFNWNHCKHLWCKVIYNL